MGPLLGDARSELQRRPGHGLQCLALPLGVGPAQQERRFQRQGCGPPLPRAYTRLPGLGINSRKQCTVQQGQRPVGLIGPHRGGKGLDGQGRQMHGDPAGNRLHSLTTAVTPSARRRRGAGFDRQRCP